MSVSKQELAADFILENGPKWLFHPEVLRRLNVKRIDLHEKKLCARGMASVDGTVSLNAQGTAKFRHKSPYSAPGGKSDMSPLGVYVHELGHMLHFALLRLRRFNGPRWKEIYTGLRRDAITSYAKVHAHEDLAETFRLFILNPKLLNELSAERYVFMKQAVAAVFPEGLRAFHVRKLADRKDAFGSLIVLKP